MRNLAHIRIVHHRSVLDLVVTRFFVCRGGDVVEFWINGGKSKTSIEILEFQVELRLEFYKLHPQIITFLL